MSSPVTLTSPCKSYKSLQVLTSPQCLFSSSLLLSTRLARVAATHAIDCTRRGEERGSPSTLTHSLTHSLDTILIENASLSRCEQGPYTVHGGLGGRSPHVLDSDFSPRLLLAAVAAVPEQELPAEPQLQHPHVAGSGQSRFDRLPGLLPRGQSECECSALMSPRCAVLAKYH